MSGGDYIARVRDNVPGILPGLPVWLLWKESRAPGDKKAKKMPFYANGNWRDKTDTPDDRAQLVTFEEAASVFDPARASGLGVALGRSAGRRTFTSAASTWTAATNAGALDPRAQQLVEVAGSYVEKSPSGTGLHIRWHGRRWHGEGRHCRRAGNLLGRPLLHCDRRAHRCRARLADLAARLPRWAGSCTESREDG
jgi:primase-polymerase (primpol)-like protein